MADEENKMSDGYNSAEKQCRNKKRRRRYGNDGVAGWVFFVAFIGAAVYFIQQANSFGMGVLGFLKAIVWPYFLIYNLLEFLNV